MDKHVTGGSYDKNNRKLVITRQQDNDDSTVTPLSNVEVDLAPITEYFKPTWYNDEEVN